ncbi:hypothetical protein [Rubrivirga sp. IMCC45206]|uniref:hypothetical protein n=1 Tax=Rubrivirga sp. IMCC45206 TaxID=3391614 RepID=UPI00398FAC28
MTPTPDPDNLPEVSADTVAQLFFDFLRQLSTLSLAAAGGTVTLMQTVLAESASQGLLVGGVAALFLAALFALQTQQVLVERLAGHTKTMRPQDGGLARLKMKRTSANEQRLMYLAFGLFGAGLTMVGVAVVNDFLL